MVALTLRYHCLRIVSRIYVILIVVHILYNTLRTWSVEPVVAEDDDVLGGFLAEETSGGLLPFDVSTHVWPVRAMQISIPHASVDIVMAGEDNIA